MGYNSNSEYELPVFADWVSDDMRLCIQNYLKITKLTHKILGRDKVITLSESEIAIFKLFQSSDKGEKIFKYFEKKIRLLLSKTEPIDHINLGKHDIDECIKVLITEKICNIVDKVYLVEFPDHFSTKEENISNLVTAQKHLSLALRYIKDANLEINYSSLLPRDFHNNFSYELLIGDISEMEKEKIISDGLDILATFDESLPISDSITFKSLKEDEKEKMAKLDILTNKLKLEKNCLEEIEKNFKKIIQSAIDTPRPYRETTHKKELKSKFYAHKFMSEFENFIGETCTTGVIRIIELLEDYHFQEASLRSSYTTFKNRNSP